MSLSFYVNNLSDWRNEILSALEDQVSRMGLGATEPAVFEHSDPSLPKSAVVLFLSDRSYAGGESENASLRTHIAAGRSVIPVVDELEGVVAKLPECLHSYNAYAVGKKERHYGRLIDKIITELWLRRSTRKVFLSYKRSESSAIAHQLRDLLSRCGYRVFLDECTLDVGADVQREIFWSLNDVDQILLLCSPGLEKSLWVLQEIAAANATEVPILGIIWPQCKPPRSLYPDQLHALAESDFLSRKRERAPQELGPEGLRNLLRVIETFRTAAVQQRLVSLLPYVRDSIDPRYRPRDTSALGDLELQDPSSGCRLYLRVLPFRATIDEAYDLRCEMIAHAKPPSRAYLFYPENDPTDRRRTALDWAFQPSRTDEKPSRYRLLSYLGDGKADLGELASWPLPPSKS